MLRFREEMFTTNKCLLLNWAAATVLFFFVYLYRIFNDQVHNFVWLVVFAYEDICFCVFLTILFKLENMIIRMDKEVDSKTMRARIRMSSNRWIVYLLLMVLVKVLEFPGLTRINADFTNTASFAIVNFIFKILTFFIRVYTHLYLIFMALKMQEMFRQFGHVSDYKAEIVIFVTYFFFFG